MTEVLFYRVLLLVWVLSAAAFAVALWIRPAPYGRHLGQAAGPSLAARWGWRIMETPAVLGMAYWFAAGHRGRGVELALLVLWLVHYVDRAWLYPSRLSPTARPMPWEIVAAGFLFQVVNSYLIGRWLFTLGPGLPAGWALDPRFLLGVALFAIGFSTNRWADTVLGRLRSREDGYSIPRGGLFEWISCPNYLGEIVLWSGFALAAWSPPTLAFALWTVANLVPRARAHHRWMDERFAGYPKQRRALVPYLW